MSDLDLDQLIHTAEGRLVLEVLQSRRLPLLIAATDKGEVIFWYPPSVLGITCCETRKDFWSGFDCWKNMYSS